MGQDHRHQPEYGGTGSAGEPASKGRLGLRTVAGLTIAVIAAGILTLKE
jgi:hypothetical protein